MSNDDDKTFPRDSCMLCTRRIKIRDDGDNVWGNGGRNECAEEEGGMGKHTGGGGGVCMEDCRGRGLGD